MKNELLAHNKIHSISYLVGKSHNALQSGKIHLYTHNDDHYSIDRVPNNVFESVDLSHIEFHQSMYPRDI